MNAQDQISYDVGWDLARYGRDLPDNADSFMTDGFRSWAHENKRRAQRPDVFEKKWLQIRVRAQLRGKRVGSDVTPQMLQDIFPRNGLCPVTHERMTIGQLSLSDWSVERANNNRDYELGNIIIISARANKAKGSLTYWDLRSRECGEIRDDGLTPEQWGRLADLVEPMHANGDRLKPVERLSGESIALGTKISQVARLQCVLQNYARLYGAADYRGAPPVMRRHAEIVKRIYISIICQSKAQRRSFIRLLTEVCRRANAVEDGDRIWKTKRVSRMLDLFLKTLPADGREAVLAKRVTHAGVVVDLFLKTEGITAGKDELIEEMSGKTGAKVSHG